MVEISSYTDAAKLGGFTQCMRGCVQVLCEVVHAEVEVRLSFEFEVKVEKEKVKNGRRKKRQLIVVGGNLSRRR